MPSYCSISALAGHCGTQIVHHFYNSSGGRLAELITKNLLDETKTALVGTFINSSACHESYKELRKHYKVVCQSPLLVNRNTGRKYFLAMFVRKGEKV